MELTKRQREVLEAIRESVRERGYPPSIRELCDMVGLSSTSTVHRHLSRLEDKGFIRRDPTRPRAIELVDGSLFPDGTTRVPVIGEVRAGEPLLAQQNIEDYFPLPDAMTRGSKVFMLKVKGDSMIGAGIIEGDHVIVRRQETAEDGDIIVALIQDEATVKRFFLKEDEVVLKPENPAMEPIITRDVRILGKVIGLFRKM